jgi:rhodanese-related sulfurtransferase
MVDNVSPQATWEALNSDPDARLVDVRTEAEWRTVGIPDLAAAGKEIVLLPWQFGPGQLNPDFVAGLAEAGLAPAQPLYFICRSGARSAAAATAARAAGYGTVYNVANGFEGGGDSAGWKPLGLPTRLP